MNPHAGTTILFGRIFGGEGFAPPQWEEAVAVQGESIVAVGTQARLTEAFPKAERRHFRDCLILPGLADAHLHLSAGGQTMGMVDLGGLELQAVRERLTAAGESGPDGEWIEAFNLDAHLCPLDAGELERILPGRAVLVNKRDLHSAVVSRTALKRAAISETSADPAGGRLGRDLDGRLSGLLFEEAVEMVRAAMPPVSDAKRLQWIRLGLAHLRGLGLTAVSEVLEPGCERLYRSLDEAGELQLDIDAWLRVEEWDGSSPPPPDGGRFRLRTLKLFLDGAFGARTAALEQPYEGEPDNRGMLFYEDGELRSILRRARRAGWRVALHAIGDRAARQCAEAMLALPAAERPVCRLEHLQQASLQLCQLIAESGAMASLQPIHLLDDGAWLPERIGPARCWDSFPWKRLLNLGITVALGSDWPVASPDPLLNLQVAVNRRGRNGEGYPEMQNGENLQGWEAVRALTEGWATAAGRCGQRGRLSAGQIADITIVRGVSEELSDWTKARAMASMLQGKLQDLSE